MATLPTLRPSSLQGSLLFATTTVTNVNDASDATYAQTDSSPNATYSVGYFFDDTPADCATVTTVTINCRVALSATGDDGWTIADLRVHDSGDTIIFTGGFSPTAVTITGYTTLTSSGTVSGGFNSKAQWDGAYVFVQGSNPRNMSADGNALRIADIWLTGTYAPKPTLPPFRRLIDRRPRGNFITSTRF